MTSGWPGSSAVLARSANFVRWAVSRRHASCLTAPATRWTGPSGPLDQDRRWADARRLLHDDAYPPADRVAGLLILLYAQKLNVITALTTQHVLHRRRPHPPAPGQPPDRAARPAGRPRHQARGRPQRTRAPACSTSLPPGCSPGAGPEARSPRTRSPSGSTPSAISPRQGRSTALFTLAAEVPAAILAKTLGIHIQAAIQWQKISAGDWTAYAADVSRRLEH